MDELPVYDETWAEEHVFGHKELKKQIKIDNHFIRLAWVMALNLSKDPNTKVGAIITSKDGRHVSFGYNGMPKGLEETKEIWERPTKYRYVIHAEPNSIINCPFDTKGCTIYTTHKPCHRCLGQIVNAGIDRLVYNEEYFKEQDQEAWDKIAERINEITQVSDDAVLKLIKDNKEKF